ncbi:MAG TPA: AI-2E family transporter [Candidatus Dormibacteraeota bacterium]|nr:AI-2E family transporter [Candidatus Dormibacteraeota bacterium]
MGGRRVVMSFEITERQRRWLDVLIALATVIAFFVAANLVAGVLQSFGDVILVFFLSWLVSFMISPLATALARLVPVLNRAAAVVVVYVLLLLAVVWVVFIVAQTLATSINEFIASIPRIQQDLPGILRPIQNQLNSLGLGIDAEAQLGELLRSIQTGAVGLVGPLQQLAVAGVGIAGNLLIIVVLSIYIAVDRPRITSFVMRLVPPRYEADAKLLSESVTRSFGGFIRGQILIGVAYALVAAATSLALGLDFMPLTSVTAGVLMAIPFFGPFVSWAPPVLVAIFFQQSAILPAIVSMGVGWFVVQNILQPRLMAGAVGLHPIVVLASVIIGSKVAGVAGAIFAIPVAAIIASFFFEYLGRQRSGTVAERAARRLEDREGRPVRVPREPVPGADLDVDDTVDSLSPISPGQLPLAELAAAETTPAPTGSDPATAEGSAAAASSAAAGPELERVDRSGDGRGAAELRRRLHLPRRPAPEAE